MGLSIDLGRRTASRTSRRRVARTNVNQNERYEPFYSPNAKPALRVAKPGARSRLVSDQDGAVRQSPRRLLSGHSKEGLGRLDDHGVIPSQDMAESCWGRLSPAHPHHASIWTQIRD